MSGRDRLATVRRVRELLERRALGRLAAGKQRVAEAGERVEAARDAYERGRAIPVASPEELRAARLIGLGAHEDVLTATADLDVAVHRHGELEVEWSQASAQRKSAERLEERRALAATAAAERAAWRALDELVAQRGSRR